MLAVLPASLHGWFSYQARYPPGCYASTAYSEQPPAMLLQASARGCASPWRRATAGSSRCTSCTAPSAAQLPPRSRAAASMPRSWRMGQVSWRRGYSFPAASPHYWAADLTVRHAAAGSRVFTYRHLVLLLSLPPLLPLLQSLRPGTTAPRRRRSWRQPPGSRPLTSRPTPAPMTLWRSPPRSTSTRRVSEYEERPPCLPCSAPAADALLCSSSSSAPALCLALPACQRACLYASMPR